MTRTEALRIARQIRSGADPQPFQIDGVLPDEVLDAIVDLSLKGA